MRRRSVRGCVGEEAFKMFKGNSNEDRKMYAGVKVSKTSYSDKCLQCCHEHSLLVASELPSVLSPGLGVLFLLHSHPVTLPWEAQFKSCFFYETLPSK